LITVINTQTVNFLSVVNILKKIGYKSILTDDANIIINSKIIIFPGVGNFDTVMSKVYEKKIDKAIFEAIDKGSKILGICVGMQALFNESAEGKLKGLGIIDGKIKKFISHDKSFKVPHMGWNQLTPASSHPSASLFSGLPNGSRAYFLHGYHLTGGSEDQLLATADYGDHIVAAVARDNMIGLQFHPEKSQQVGQVILANWLRHMP